MLNINRPNTPQSFAFLFFASLVVLLAAGIAVAQVTTARLEGVVKDKTGGVVPGAAVVAKNLGTNIPYETITNEVGLFVLPKLSPGSYYISCELAGFKRYVIPEMVLQVGDNRSIQVTLETGEITQEVVVTAEMPTVDTTTQNIGNVVQEKQILDLPLNGRNAMNLFYLQAGANPLVAAQASGNFGQQHRGNVDGMRVVANNVTVEGVWAQDPMLENGPGMVSFAIPLDAVGEYRVVTSSASAEYGRGGGAQVQAVYKSGTNAMHGSVYDFNRNTLYNANNFFLNRVKTADGSKAKRPVFLRNQFGASVGGPIQKDKTFYFGTYEGQRERQATIVNRTVFTQSLRDGVFRHYNKGANSVSLVDPTTGAPKVPASDISTINLLQIDPTRLGADPSGRVAGILKQVPLPNNYDLGDGFNTAGHRSTSPLPDDYNQYVVKVDHRLATNHSLSVSHSYVRENVEAAKTFSGFPASTTKEVHKSGVISLLSTLRPTLLNEFRLGGQLRSWHFLQPNPANFDIKGNYQLAGLGSGRGGAPNGNPVAVFLTQEAPTPVFNFNDNLTWVRSNHTFKAGADVRILRSNVNFGGDFYIPVISSDNSFNPANVPALPGLNSNDRARAQQLTNDLTGTVGFIQQDFKANSKTQFTPFEPPHRYWRAREYSFFFQDTWKVRDNLTLNLGLRYEVYGVPFESKGIFTQPVGGVAGIFGAAGPTKQPTKTAFAEDGGGKVYSVDWNNFAPNLGFTWDPFKDGKTSISANYRMAYDRVAMTQHLFLDFSNEGTTATVRLFPQNRFSDPNIYQAVGGKAPIFPLPVPKLFADVPITRAGVANTVDPDLYVPYTSSWSLRIQREVWAKTTLSIAYVGNKGTGMHRAYNINQVEIRKNGFLDGFLAAQRNLSKNGNPNIGEDIGVLGKIFPTTTAGRVGNIPASLNTLVSQGQAANVADLIDRSLGGGSGALLTAAGLPQTLLRINPQFLNGNIVGNNSNSTYHGMKLEVTRRFSGGLYFQANYTLSKSLTDYVGGQSQADNYRDNENYRLDKSLANFDATHVINTNGLYELPFGRNSHGLVRHLIGNWQLNGIFAYATGWPLTVATGRTNLTLGDASTANYSGKDYKIFANIIRGDQIGTITAAQKAQFSNPAAGSPGGTPQRAFRSIPYWTTDMSVFKDVHFTESMRLQMRFEFFNLFNHTNFDQRFTNTNINSAAFGNITAALSPRIMQLAAKFIF